MKVLVLCGGASSERVVSWASGDAVAKWVEEAGHEVLKYDPEQPGRLLSAAEPIAPPEIGNVAPLPANGRGFEPAVVQRLLSTLEKVRPEAVFPIFHSGYGEDGTLQALLDWVKMPYTGSGATACALAMNKHITRVLCEAAGIPVASGFWLPRARFGDTAAAVKQTERVTGFPVVVKPLRGGSTIGLSKVYGAGEMAAALQAVAEQQDDVLVESLFEGRELTCTVINGTAYPLIEIRPKAGFYDYHNKYTHGRTEYLCPAPVSEATAKQLQQHAVTIFDALGCAGFARIDFLLNDAGEYVCLEVNTLPGMTQNSLVPKAVRAMGETLPDLMNKLLLQAVRAVEATA